MRVDPRIDFSSSTFTEVLFSPDEKLLLRQDGTTLTLHDLRDVTNFQQLVPRGAQAPATDCVEKFVDGPEHWCGSAGASGRITWSSDSRFALGRAPSGDLIAWDFAAVSGSSISATSLCSASCTDAFAFQP